MYFLKQIQDQYISMLANYQDNPDGFGSFLEEMDIPEQAEVADSDVDIYERVHQIYTDGADIRQFLEGIDAQDWYTELDPELQEEVMWWEESALELHQSVTRIKTLFELGRLEEIDISEYAVEGEEEISEELMRERITEKIADLERRRDEILEQIYNVESDETRERRYTTVEEEFEAIAQNEQAQQIIWGRSFEEITAGEFYALKKENPELLASLLLSTENWERVDTEFLSSEDAVGTVLRVNFWRNQWLDRIVGAGDILPIQHVQSIKVNGVVWERRWEPRPGYYTPSGQYLAIHDGYRIEIMSIEMLEGEAWETFRWHIDRRYQEIRGAEVVEAIQTDLQNFEGETFVFDAYTSDSDTELIRGYIQSKLPDFLQDVVTLEWQPLSITVSEPYSFSELASVLSEYQDIYEWISQYFSDNSSLFDGTSFTLSRQQFEQITWVTWENQDFVRAAIESLLVEDADVEVDYSDENIRINARGNTLGDVFSFSQENFDIDGISPEALRNLPENRRRVISTANTALQRGDILWAAHCTDWVDKIYQRSIGRSVYDTPRIYEWWVTTWARAVDSRDTGLRYRDYAQWMELERIQPWDHIMVDHGPNYGRGRTHSVIALENPTNGMLRVVSYPWGGRAPRIDLYDLTGQGRNGGRPERAIRIHTPA